MTTKAYSAEYRRKHLDEINAKQIAAYAAAPQKKLAYMVKYHAKNRGKRLAYLKSYREQNREKHIKSVQEWRKQNPEQAARNRRKYVISGRARKRNAAGFYTSEAWLQKCAYYGWKCIYCTCSLTEQTVTTDHRKPLSKGGSNWLANLAPACKSCNSRKQAKLDFQKVA